jgi:hypothetical protein
MFVVYAHPARHECQRKVYRFNVISASSAHFFRHHCRISVSSLSVLSHSSIALSLASAVARSIPPGFPAPVG